MTTKKHDGPHFVMVTETVLDAPAWRAMSHGARNLYIALKRRYWPNRKNNGHIYLPQRQAAKELGSNITEIVRWFRELQYYGFIVMMTPGYLGVDGKGRAPRWRLTEVAYMRGTSSKGTEDMSTMDFLKWDGVRFSKHQSGGGQSKPKTKSRSGKRERTAPENGSTHAPENGSTCHNYRSGKREQGNGLSAPENGDKSINHVGGRVGPMEEESSEHRECEATRLASLADDNSPQPTLVEPAARTNGAQHQAATDAVADVPDQKAKREADQLVSAPDPGLGQPVLVMQDSKEHAGVPPQAKQPDAVAAAPNQAIEKFLVSTADAARYGVVYRRLREERGEPAAKKEMVWELSAVAMVPPNKLPRELERIQRLAAGHRPQDVV